MTAHALEQAVRSSQRLANTTQSQYLQRVRAFVEFAGNDWTAKKLEDWRDAMLHDGKSAKSVNLYMTSVRFAARRAKVLGYLPEDFTIGAERARIPDKNKKPKQRALSIDQIKQLVGTCRGHVHDPRDLRDRAMLFTSLHAAFRRNALCTLTTAKIGTNLLTVREKGGAEHTVKVDHPEAWGALQDWLRWLRRRGVSNGPVFRSLRRSLDEAEWSIGGKITPDGWFKILQARAKSVGIGNVTPHTLRHTFTSLALSSGVEPWRVELVLGHKRNVMMEHYAHDLGPSVGSVFPYFER